MAATRPLLSVAIDSQPRLPGPSLPGTIDARPNDVPPLSDRAVKIRVPCAALAVHSTTIDTSPPRGTSDTRGGCSPLTAASPGTAFTLTRAPKVAPASRLTAA